MAPVTPKSACAALNPLHLACIDWCWYLLAWDPSREDVRTFALRRIRRIRMTASPANHAESISRNNSTTASAPTVATTRRHSPAPLGPRRQHHPELLWHKSQKFEPVPGEPGKKYMTMRVSQNPRLTGWICDWLGNIAVLEPSACAKTSRTPQNKATKINYESEPVGTVPKWLKHSNLVVLIL
jgi:predicted DNA-binding transcriptional regulator YafY